jgi:hypothetical protein
VLLVTGIVLFATAPTASAQAGRLRIVPALAVGANSTLVGATGRF